MSLSYSKKSKYNEDMKLEVSVPLKIVMDNSEENARTVRYPCMKCPRIFVERDQLNIHYTHTHREKPQYVCEICSTVFLVKRELSTHLRIHSGEQPHKCTICGKEFGTRQLLKKHFMWHTGERSHVCPHCPKAFFQVKYFSFFLQCLIFFKYTYRINKDFNNILERSSYTAFNDS